MFYLLGSPTNPTDPMLVQSRESDPDKCGGLDSRPPGNHVESPTRIDGDAESEDSIKVKLAPLDLRTQELYYRQCEPLLHARASAGCGGLGWTPYCESVYAHRVLGSRQPTEPNANNASKRKRNDSSGKNTSAMHAKNMYSRPEYTPDFAELARQYPVLRKHLQDRGYNFTSWEACRDLVAVQFHHDLGVKGWTVPRPHLIPPLANRLNYLCYVHDLLERDGRLGDTRRVQILDVGCGANMVYPLLAAAYFRWRCFGCDVNREALLHAATIREKNMDIGFLIVLLEASGLSALKRVRKCAEKVSHGPSGATDTVGLVGPLRSGPLVADLHTHSANEDDRKFDIEYVDAVVCNPPFFDSDVGEAAGQNPRTDYGGTEQEMWCPGGEEAFVVALIRESKSHRDRCGWFSAMVGKKKTLKAAKAALAELEEEEEGGDHGVTFRVRALEQGVTTRWVVAWRWE